MLWYCAFFALNNHICNMEAALYLVAPIVCVCYYVHFQNVRIVSLLTYVGWFKGQKLTIMLICVFDICNLRLDTRNSTRYDLLKTIWIGMIYRYLWHIFIKAHIFFKSFNCYILERVVNHIFHLVYPFL